MSISSTRQALLLLVGAAAVVFADSIQVTPLNATAGFGAEVLIPHALSAHDLPPAETEQLRQALAQHHVLLFPGLGHRLSMQDHVAFARQFGHVDPWVSRPPPYVQQQVHVSADTESLKMRSQPRNESHAPTTPNTPCPVREASSRNGCTGLQQTIIATREAQLVANEPSEVFKIVVAEDDKLAFGEGYHTDLTYLAHPPVAAVLAARQLPPVGLGDTLFMSAHDLLDALPESVREQIGTARAVHTDKAGREAVHPMVQRVNGRDALNVNRHFTRHMLEADAEARADGVDGASALLQQLFAHIVDFSVDHSLRVSWSPGLVVMWDERSTQHAGVHDYAGYRREMHRVLISDGAEGEPHAASSVVTSRA